jgi:dihydroorotase
MGGAHVMNEHYELIVRGGTVLFPWGAARADLGLRDGHIACLDVPAAASGPIFRADGLHVLPGIIDPHVHFRDPGDGSVETLESGTRGAVLGGVTTIFDMPNTVPAIADDATIALKRNSVPGRAWCDVGFYVGATRANTPDLGRYERVHGVCAIKVFAGSSTGDLMIEDDAGIEAVLRHGYRRVAFHSEDEYRLQARRNRFRLGDPYACHAEWRDPECALLCTTRLVALARRTGRPIHILHVSTEEEFGLLGRHRSEASVEVLVNHLTQVAPECYDRLGGYAVMNPPLRDRRHHDAAWAALNDGRVDTIASDHAPHSRAAKERPWPSCASGLTGVQTLLPVMLDHVAAGRTSLARLADAMAAGPARIYGLRGKGRIAVGYDADLTVVDLLAERRIENSAMASRCGWTPFDGMRVTGWPVATVLRGSVVMRDGAVVGAPAGTLVGFA